MEKRLCNIYNNIVEGEEYIQSILTGDMYYKLYYDSTIFFTMMGTKLAYLLNIDNNTTSKVIILNGTDSNNYLFLTFTQESDIHNKLKNIWNWKIWYCILHDDYFLIDKNNIVNEYNIISNDYKINGLNPLECLYHNIYSTVDWKSVKQQLLLVSKYNNTDDILENAINTAFRIILLGNEKTSLYGNNIITEIDGETIYQHNLTSLSLNLYNNMDGLSKQGKKKYLLYRFKDIKKTSKYKKTDYTSNNTSFCVDGIPLNYLLTNGLMEKLNDFFKVTTSKLSITYEKNKTKGIGELYLSW